MRKIALLLIIFALLLAACASPTATPTLDATVPRPIPSSTATPTAIPSPGAVPSQTPTPTRMPTSLPTILTFTPTFDVRRVVTVTPELKAACPQEKNNVNAKIFDGQKALEPEAIAQKMLDLLNQGIPRQQLLNELSMHKTSWGGEYGPFIQKDLTNDSIPELIAQIAEGFAIYHCNSGHYELSLKWFGSAVAYVDIFAIRDMNLDGIPEVVASARACSGVGCQDIEIYEWNGSEFKNIGGAGSDGPQGEEIVDINGDGMLELVVRDGGSMCCRYLPHRFQTTIYMWNGTEFAASYQHFFKPVYRFEAIQDADRETRYGHYDQALLLYQQAISDNLDWWSPARSAYVQDLQDNFFFSGDETPVVTPTATRTPPAMDETEYPRLAAYAMYRIMILRIYLGEMDSAQTQYATLQKKFPVGNAGHPYAEMANAFWDSYQPAQKLYDACAAAISYADAHRQMLVPLGSAYHSPNTDEHIIYTPADVCPFR